MCLSGPFPTVWGISSSEGVNLLLWVDPEAGLKAQEALFCTLYCQIGKDQIGSDTQLYCLLGTFHFYFGLGNGCFLADHSKSSFL